MDNEKVIDINTGKMGDQEALKRKLKLIKSIAIDSSIAQLQDVRTFQFAAGIGLWQGLKYRGSLKEGFKAGVAGLAVITGCNVVSNLIKQADEIKKV